MSECRPCERETVSPSVRNAEPWHLSPSVLCWATAAGGCALTFFPPEVYEQILGEPDHMFGNLRVLAYVLLCSAALVFGAQVPRLRFYKSVAAKQPDSNVSNVGLWPVYWAAGIVVFIIAALVMLMREQLTGIVLGALSGQAGEVRDAIVENLRETGFSPTNFLPLALPLVYLSAGAVLTVTPEQQDSARFRRARRVHLWTTWAYAITLVITLQRNLLVPFLLGLFCLHSGLAWHQRGIHPYKLLRTLVLGLVGFAMLFFAFSYSRSGSDESPWTLLMGYVPASYNRLAYQLDGELTSPMAYPYYSLRFFWHPPLIRRLVPVSAIAESWGVQLPETSIEGWIDEFANIANIGLDERFIWPTAYGYVFYDYGWLAVFYFGLFGIFCGLAWRSFCRQRLFGLMVYPYFASCILLFSTDMIVALPQTVAVLFAAVMLMLLKVVRDGLIARRRAEAILTVPITCNV